MAKTKQPVTIEGKIAEVLADQWTPSHVVYGTEEPQGFDSPRDWAEYVAEVLVAELGLREERRTNPMSSSGQTTDTKTGVTTFHSNIRYDRRWVTDWRSES